MILPNLIALSAGTVEYTNWFSAKKQDFLDVYPWYDTKQSDSEVLVILDLWKMQRTPLLPRFPGPLCSGMDFELNNLQSLICNKNKQTNKLNLTQENQRVITAQNLVSKGLKFVSIFSNQLLKMFLTLFFFLFILIYRRYTQIRGGRKRYIFCFSLAWSFFPGIYIYI